MRRAVVAFALAACASKDSKRPPPPPAPDAAPPAPVDPDAPWTVTLPGKHDQRVAMAGGKVHVARLDGAKIAVSRHGPGGKADWTFTAPVDSSNAQIFDVAVAPDGRVAVVGRLVGRFDLPIWPLEDRGGGDAFVMVLKDSGELWWAMQLGSRNIDFAVAATWDGNDLIVAGRFRGAFAVDEQVYTARAELDGYVARIGVPNQIEWLTHVGPVGGVVRAGDGDLWIATTTEGARTMIGGVAVTGGGKAGNLVVARLEPTGKPRWAKAFPSAGFASADDLVVHGDGVALLGAFEQRATFGAQVLESPADLPMPAVVASFDAAGDPRWATVFPFELGDPRIAAGPDGVLVVGERQGPATFANASIAPLGTSAVVVAAFSSDGAPTWADTIDTDQAGFDRRPDIAAEPGRFAIVATTDGTGQALGADAGIPGDIAGVIAVRPWHR